MTTLYSPETSIIDSCIFKCEPESRDSVWLGIEKSTVLVTVDFTTDPWLLEDVHRLHQEWVVQT